MAGGDSAARAPDSPVHPGSGHRPSDAPQSFAAVYKAYFDFVWSSVRRFGVSEDAVDDVVQEAFVIIHARLHTLRQPDSLRSWVYGVVRRTVSGYRRSQRAKGAAEFAPDVADASLSGYQLTPLEQTERNGQLQLLAQLLSELDDAKREVFVLAEIEEMTAPEIAEALDIPLNTAYSRLRAARQGFEQALSRHTARERAGRR
jgi:RNA polymerase sigma-70 factor (ECF subfamily)